MFQTRREFLALAAAIGVLDAVGPSLEALAQAGPVRVRQNIKTFVQDQQKVNALRTAVKQMQEVSASKTNDPKGWTYWANSHGTNGSVPPSLANIYNQCQHGTDHFLSWHRAFLFFFESVLKQSAKDAGDNTDFELPYWDWYTQPVMPRSFTRQTDPFGKPNPLWHARQSTDLSDAVLDRSAFSWDNMLPAPRTPQNRTFSYVLEGDPHGLVHSLVGRDMGFIDRSARDPIFWLHHANIDRLWSYWMKGGSRTLPAENSPWGHTTFIFDTAGTMTREVGPLLNSETSLGYRYEDETEALAPHVAAAAPTISASSAAAAPGSGRQPIVIEAKPADVTFGHQQGLAPNRAAGPVALSSTTAPLTLGNSAVAVNMPLSQPSADQIHGLVAQSPKDLKSASLVLENVELGRAGQEGGFGFRIVATLTDPGGGAPRRAIIGSLNTFGLSVQAHAEGKKDVGKQTLKFPLSDILSELNLKSADELTKGLRITFEPAHSDEVGGVEPDFVKIGAVKIVGSE